jgi:DNA invertase Pin-like site-specific DNA recombinase
MTATRIGYARCSTDKQDLAAQRAALEQLGVTSERIYTDHGLTGTSRTRPGLDQALAAVRAGDTLVVTLLHGWGRLASGAGRRRKVAASLTLGPLPCRSKRMPLGAITSPSSGTG